MAAHLVPCPTCQRHVRVSETACPFCATALDESTRDAEPSPLPTTRLSRSALHTFRASLTTAVVIATSAAAGATFACSSDNDTNSGYGQQQAGGTSSGGNASAAGNGSGVSGSTNAGGSGNGSSGASSGGTSNTGGTNTGGTNTGGMNAGGDTAAGGNDGFGGGAVALYGAVPVDPNPGTDVDAGKGDGGPDDPGGIQPLYGAASVPS